MLHSTMIKSSINFLPFIKFIYLPYMMLNLVGFYIINLIVKVPINESHSLSGIKYGIIILKIMQLSFQSCYSKFYYLHYLQLDQ